MAIDNEENNFITFGGKKLYYFNNLDDYVEEEGKYIVKEKYFKIMGSDKLTYLDGSDAYYYIDIHFYCIENEGLFELLLGKKIYSHRLESRDLVSYKLNYYDRSIYADRTEAERVNYAIHRLLKMSKYRDSDEYIENSGYMFKILAVRDKQNWMYSNWRYYRNKEVDYLRDWLLTFITNHLAKQEVK